MKIGAWKRPSVCLVLFAMILSPVSVFPMIKTLKIPELVGQSDIIVIGRVLEKKRIAATPKRGGSLDETIENVIFPVRVLKGVWVKGRPMSFITRQTTHAGKRAWREDALAFPEKGAGVVVFVKRQGRSELSVVNGIQGLWPMSRDGSLQGMGSSHSIDELEREIARERSGGRRGK